MSVYLSEPFSEFHQIMSLINQMLKDLDARHEAPEAGADWSVRSLPVAPASRLPYVLAFAALVALALVIYVLWEPAEAPVPQPVIQPIQKIETRTAPEKEESLWASLRLADVLEPVEKKSRARRDPSPELPKPENPRKEEKHENHEEPEKTPEHVSIQKTDPQQDPAEMSYRQAADAADQGRTVEAQERARAALNSNSRHTAARQLLLRLLLAEQRVDAVIQTLREGLREQPEQITWAITLARLYVERGELAEAAQIMQQSLPAASSSPDYLGFSGHLQQRLGHVQEAAALYQAAALIAPDDGRWWLGLGLAQESEGHKEQALAAFRRASQCANLSRELSLLVEQKLKILE